jgi:hypothetical protein
MTKRISRVLACAFAASSLGSWSFARAAPPAWPSTSSHRPAPDVPGMPEALARELRSFDDLDFRVYSNRDWVNMHRSHAADILVHYPDGHTSEGIPAHVKELEGMWTFAPDNRITDHPVRFGTADGRWTAVMGFLDGTFTKPMVLPDGRSIAPTGKSYHLPMATLGRWNAQGSMSEEYLFWDMATLMQQMGIDASPRPAK